MVNKLLKTALGRLRIVAFMEGCSYLLLGFTMILKYKFSMPQPNYIVGLAHGFIYRLTTSSFIFTSLEHTQNLYGFFSFTYSVWNFLCR